jgi:hypothetical protein
VFAALSEERQMGPINGKVKLFTFPFSGQSEALSFFALSFSHLFASKATALLLSIFKKKNLGKRKKLCFFPNFFFLETNLKSLYFSILNK